MQSLIFDLDGVLVDSDLVHRNALKSAAAQFSFSINDVGTGTTISKLQASGVPEDLIPEIYALKRKLYDEHMRTALVANPEVSTMFLRLNSRGYKMAVCSNSNLTSVRLVLGKIGLLSMLTAVTSSSEVARGKPYPDVYTLTLERLRTTPEKAVVFEDSEDGISAAKSAGISNVVKCTTYSLVKEASKWL